MAQLLSSNVTGNLTVTQNTTISGNLLVQTRNVLPAIDSAANTVRVSQNSGSTLSAKQLNFVNTATATVSVTDSGTGNANIAITVVGGAGSQGVQGSQGFQGIQGAVGSQGFQGVQGNQGFQGVQGVQGALGNQGNQGNQGFQGVQGNQGFQGVQGIQGALGNQGNQGNQGFQGIQGNQGFQGVQGNQGFQGIQGATGTGVQGSQGSQGAAGGGGGSGTFPVSSNSGSTVTANGINFINTSTVSVTVTAGISGNANVTLISTGSPGGSNTFIQYNNNGVFGGDAGFYLNTAANLISTNDNLRLSDNAALYFGGQQANNSAANAKVSIQYNVATQSLDIVYLG